MRTEIQQKKEYTAPQMKIIPVKVQATLLENSDPWGVYIVPRE